MPKMKTHKGASKRFSVKKSGKVVRAQSNKRHILTKMSQDRKRRLRGNVIAAKCDAPRIRKMLVA